MNQDSVKHEIGQFYDEIGWQLEAEGVYQNARYEDLRPVSAEYIHKCHMRVKRYLAPSGKYLLDGGSGPVQYDEYLTYSEGYQYRVCMDLSLVALVEARKRLGEKGIYINADIANLPFRSDVFDGIVSLHTIHHVPIEEKVGVYQGLHRCLKPGRTMVTVDGWSEVPLAKPMQFLMRVANRLRRWTGKEAAAMPDGFSASQANMQEKKPDQEPVGTFVLKTSARWFHSVMKGILPYEIRVWRSVSVRFLRSVIQPEWAGRFWLKLLYRLEEWFPHYFGENGQYPLIIISKENAGSAKE
ncbi:MAG: class I SAM-dependent methyltransferase [Anaerolineaceae bacterium]|nr:class I SAM-dependent methyltransferase [Anaerolineaceae bacterium]